MPAARPVATAVLVLALSSLAACSGSRHHRKEPTSPFGALPQAPKSTVQQRSSGGSHEFTASVSASEASYEPEMAPTSDSDDGGGGSVGQATSTGGGTSGPVEVGQAPPAPGEKMVVTGSVSVYVDDGDKAVLGLRAWIAAHRGRIVGEELRGHGRRWTGDLRVRLPPDEVRAFVTALDDAGDVSESRLQAEEVTRQYFDQELQIRALKVTIARLERILNEKGLSTQEVLVIEREMERVRSQIESLEGDHRFLTDRIAFATIDVSLRVQGDVIFAPRAKVHPGPRLSLLFPVDAPDTDAILGGGVTLHFEREFSLDLDLFPADGARERILVTTLGGATYSDFAGGGKNRFLNPYLGFRTGYAHTGKGSAWVVGGEVGVELLKLPWLLVEVSGRGLALVDEDGGDLAIMTTLGLEIPF